MTPLLFKEAQKQSYLHEGDRQHADEAHTQTHKHYNPLHCEYHLISQDGQRLVS